MVSSRQRLEIMQGQRVDIIEEDNDAVQNCSAPPSPPVRVGVKPGTFWQLTVTKLREYMLQV